MGPDAGRFRSDRHESVKRAFDALSFHAVAAQCHECDLDGTSHYGVTGSLRDAWVSL